MPIHVERIGRLQRAVEAKAKRDTKPEAAASCELTYGELMLAMNGHPARGELDSLILGYKRGNIADRDFEEGLDEFFGDAVVQRFSGKDEPFRLTVNTARVKEIGRLSNELAGM